MSRDIYSNDHTIKVTGDTQTVTIEDNLTVDEVLTVSGSIDADTIAPTGGALNVTGDLEVSSDATINNTFTVVGDSTLDDLNAKSYGYTSAEETIFKWISTADLAVLPSLSSQPVSGTDTFAATYGSSSLTNYISVLVGHSTNPTWELYIQIDQYLPDGCTLTGVHFIIENETTLSPGASFSYQGDVEEATTLGSGGWTTSDSDTDTAVVTTGIRDNLSFKYSPGISISSSNALLGKSYRFKLEQTEATSANIIAILKMGLEYTVDSVDQALQVE